MPRYDAKRIEPKWQAFWDAHQTFRIDAVDPAKPKMYVLDMFPYPSGAGLHVGHPEGYTATDIVCRYNRMRGKQVLHPMGWDAFGLPAEEYAIRTGTHPAETTAKNIGVFKRQLKSLGFSYDWSRELATTDPDYYRWTQWIFLQLFDTWYDPDHTWTGPDGKPRIGRGRPIYELPIPADVAAQGREAVRRYQDKHRLAYQHEAPVNWCPALGTVLANEEIIDGKSERGGHPVERTPLRQWLLRITAYGDRLANELEDLHWPESIKLMQRNWIGRSEGAEVDFWIGHNSFNREPTASVAGGAATHSTHTVATRTDATLAAGSRLNEWRSARAKSGFPNEPGDDVLRIYTTRPDTLFGATYMVLSPEHPAVDRLTTPGQRAAVDAYRQQAAMKSDLDRTDLAKDKTGVFTGGFAINPVNGEQIPVWIADYVLISYGTGAIMAVPAHDERDMEFAVKFGLPIITVVEPPVPEGALPFNFGGPEIVMTFGDAPSACFAGEGEAVNSGPYDGLQTAEFKPKITADLAAAGLGRKAVNYRLRDWLFSRQRYWGEPFPVWHELDANGQPTGLMRTETEVATGQLNVEHVSNVLGTSCRSGTLETCPTKDANFLPVVLPEMADFKPTGTPEPMLSKAPADWLFKTAADGMRLKRETNTMPQWAGSCWYYLRFADPKNDRQFLDPAIEKAWLPVDLYVGGAEHAVLHLLYSRFWHKVLFDRGHVSTCEPFQRLVNQGMILGEVDEHGKAEKMSKSRGNVINPDTVVDEFGADSLRLYEMFMGPLEAVKPWSMKGVEGVSRFLARVWRMIADEQSETDVRLNPAVQDVPPSAGQLRVLHQTIKAVTRDIESLGFNTAISRMMEFVNEFLSLDVRPRAVMDPFVLLLSPFAPHLAEELWELLGHATTLAYEPWPTWDEQYLIETEIEIPVQINGKLRGKVKVPAGADQSVMEAAAKADAIVAGQLEGKTIVKTVIVPGKMVNFVVR
jgi:leucyl-tRNA synthetase